mmetsp:Transcript_1940/g.12186  ORF Transcript_1940/g.12186 Transcript_1940/m.12186 type:complete len:229 (+) Transcript_1940:4571-5257(+)
MEQGRASTVPWTRKLPSRLERGCATAASTALSALVGRYECASARFLLPPPRGSASAAASVAWRAPLAAEPLHLRRLRPWRRRRDVPDDAFHVFQDRSGPGHVHSSHQNTSTRRGSNRTLVVRWNGKGLGRKISRGTSPTRTLAGRQGGAHMIPRTLASGTAELMFLVGMVRIHMAVRPRTTLLQHADDVVERMNGHVLDHDLSDPTVPSQERNANRSQLTRLAQVPHI